MSRLTIIRAQELADMHAESAHRVVSSTTAVYDGTLTRAQIHATLAVAYATIALDDRRVREAPTS